MMSGLNYETGCVVNRQIEEVRVERIDLADSSSKEDSLCIESETPASTSELRPDEAKT